MTEEYFTHKQAHDEVSRYFKREISIVGIERFLLGKNGDFVADIEGIADFSDADLDESYKASIKFLSEYGLDKDEKFIIIT